jgi:hypothetical protein
MLSIQNRCLTWHRCVVGHKSQVVCTGIATNAMRRRRQPSAPPRTLSPARIVLLLAAFSLASMAANVAYRACLPPPCCFCTTEGSSGTARPTDAAGGWRAVWRMQRTADGQPSAASASAPTAADLDRASQRPGSPHDQVRRCPCPHRRRGMLTDARRPLHTPTSSRSPESQTPPLPWPRHERSPR